MTKTRKEKTKEMDGEDPDEAFLEKLGSQQVNEVKLANAEDQVDKQNIAKELVQPTSVVKKEVEATGILQDNPMPNPATQDVEPADEKEVKRKTKVEEEWETLINSDVQTEFNEIVWRCNDKELNGRPFSFSPYNMLALIFAMDQEKPTFKKDINIQPDAFKMLYPCMQLITQLGQVIVTLGFTPLEAMAQIKTQRIWPLYTVKIGIEESKSVYACLGISTRDGCAMQVDLPLKIPHLMREAIYSNKNSEKVKAPSSPKPFTSVNVKSIMDRRRKNQVNFTKEEVPDWLK